MQDLSDTERLIVSYVQAHAPEDSMLDKISTGTGKSRATVLKYLESLHSKGILDFRIIGRNKLWMLKQASLPTAVLQDAVTDTSREDLTRLMAAARELYELKARERELAEVIDRPDTLVAAIDEQLNVLFASSTFQARFPSIDSFGSLLQPSDRLEIRRAALEACAGKPVALEIDLAERAGVRRAYRLTLAPSTKDQRSPAAILTAEDVTGLKRSRRDLENLLYLIRTAGEARGEAQLLREALQGIRERLLPWVYSAVYLDSGSIAYQSQDLPAEIGESGRSLAKRSLKGMETVSSALNGKEPVYLLAVPLISDEKPAGTIVLALKAPASATDLENVEIVADEVSSVLKGLRLDREKTEYVNTLLAVNRVSAVLNETKDEARMLERSITSTMETLGFDMGCVYLKECGDEMALKVQKNMPESLYRMCLSGKFKSLFERALSEKRVVHVTPETPEYAALDSEILANGVRTILVLPIVAGTEIVGLLNMGSRTLKPYTRMSLENIASIGLQLGLALERTRLALELESQAGKDLTEGT